MVLLTADTKNLEDVLNQKQLSWEHCCKVKVLGTWASIYLIEPTDLSTTIVKHTLFVTNNYPAIDLLFETLQKNWYHKAHQFQIQKP